MDWMQTLLIGFVLFIVLAIVFRRYITALIYDYVVDCGLSFADNLLAGAGALGLDIGDWIAALLIFIKERKITNGFVAGLVAWEATNFIPFSLIPVVGEGLEIIFNFFPAVTIGRLLFNKYGPAEKEEHKLEREISLAERLGIGVSAEKKVLKKAKKLIESEDPVDALREEKRSDKEISAKLIDYVNGLMSDTNNVIQDIVNQNIQAPQEIINILQEGINASEQLLQQAKSAAENEDFETAINSAMSAKDTIINAAQQFDSAFQQYQNQLQMESTGQ
jgi:hypothetical protein